MNGFIRRHRFLIARRIMQALTLVLFFGGSAWGWTILSGNLSAAEVLNAVPLTDPYAVLQILATGNVVQAEALTGALIVLLFFGVIAGRAFCGWVCPVNMVTDAAGWLRRKVNPEASGVGARISRNTRYGVLGLSLALSAILGVAAFEWISPVSILHRGIIFGMGFGWLVILALFLFDLLAVRNGFCGHVCPLGGFYALVGRYSLLRVRHDKDHCTVCMQCTEICPEKQVLGMVGKENALVLSGECINCGKCIEACDDNAMAFGIRYFSGNK